MGTGNGKTLVAALKRTKTITTYQDPIRNHVLLEDILGGNPTIKPTTTSGTSILNTCNKRKAFVVINTLRMYAREIYSSFIHTTGKSEGYSFYLDTIKYCHIFYLL